jgi:hypothetical protein
MAEKDWIAASKLFEEIERIEPGYRDVKTLLNQTQAQVERQEKFADLVAQGKEYLGKKREWLKAIATFQQVLALDAENVEAQALLAEAEKGQEEFKPQKPASHPEKIQPSKPATLSEEARPRAKPKDLPK